MIHYPQHWQKFSDLWSRLGQPMRPGREDVKSFGRLLGGTEGMHLLLGVTPELSDLVQYLVAVDDNAGMIGAIWPGDRAGRHAVQANWLDMPFADNSFDTVMADGSFTPLDYPLQYDRLFAQLQRVLKPGGRMVVRIFAAPEAGETCATVCDEAMAGRIAGFHAFKWRLSMAATSETRNPNLNVADTYETFNRLLPDRERLAQATGWSLEDIALMDLYRNSAARYSYPTLTQFRQAIPSCFRETDIAYGSYELAECCPTLLLELDK